MTVEFMLLSLQGEQLGRLMENALSDVRVDASVRGGWTLRQRPLFGVNENHNGEISHA